MAEVEQNLCQQSLKLLCKYVGKRDVWNMLTFIVRLRNVAQHIEIKPTEMCKIMS